MKIYAASRASIAERPAMWKRLRSRGVEIVSTWIDEAERGASPSLPELWERIETEIRAADRLVLYAEKTDFPLKGALVEVGMALGMGKPVWIVTPGIELDPYDLKPLGSWAWHPRVAFSDNIEHAVGVSEHTSP